eukprot:scaffold6178_cov118-Isochrysis_galbana.AAC.2
MGRERGSDRSLFSTYCKSLAQAALSARMIFLAPFHLTAPLRRSGAWYRGVGACMRSCRVRIPGVPEHSLPAAYLTFFCGSGFMPSSVAANVCISLSAAALPCACADEQPAGDRGTWAGGRGGRGARLAIGATLGRRPALPAELIPHALGDSRPKATVEGANGWGHRIRPALPASPAPSRTARPTCRRPGWRTRLHPARSASAKRWRPAGAPELPLLQATPHDPRGRQPHPAPWTGRLRWCGRCVTSCVHRSPHRGRSALRARRTFEGGHQGGRHELIAALAHDASLAAQEWTKHVRRVAAARQRRDSTRIVRRGHAQVPGRIALDIHGQLEPLLRAHHGRTEPESLRGAEKERKNVDRQHHALKTCESGRTVLSVRLLWRDGLRQARAT